jgi:hypothetical protein
MKTELICPHCGSLEHFQKVSVLFDSETSSISATSKGVGVGISGAGLGVGVGKGKAEGTIQSKLASKLKPPPAPTLFLAGCGVAGAWLGGLFIIGASLALGFHYGDGEWQMRAIAGSLTVLAILLIVFGKSIAEQDDESQAKYDKEKSAWDMRWFCKRCGEFTEGT